jgi:hypothetical protein
MVRKWFFVCGYEIVCVLDLEIGCWVLMNVHHRVLEEVSRRKWGLILFVWLPKKNVLVSRFQCSTLLPMIGGLYIGTN